MNHMNDMISTSEDQFLFGYHTRFHILQKEIHKENPMEWISLRFLRGRVKSVRGLGKKKKKIRTGILMLIFILVGNINVNFYFSFISDKS